jgi:hypothetical protein
MYLVTEEKKEELIKDNCFFLTWTSLFVTYIKEIVTIYHKRN